MEKKLEISEKSIVLCMFVCACILQISLKSDSMKK